MKKLLIIVTIMMILLPFIPPKNHAHAVSGAAIRIVGGSVGERVVAGVLEKTGAKFATKSAREKAVERWNLEVYQKIKEAEAIGDTYKAEELQRFQNQMKSLDSTKVTAIPDKPGFGKVMLDTSLFLTGADISYDLTNTVLQMYQDGKAWERMRETTRSIASGESLSSFHGFQMYKSANCLMFGVPSDNTGFTCNYMPEKKYWSEITSTNMSGNMVTISATGYWFYQTSQWDTVGQLTSFSVQKAFIMTNATEDFQRITSVPTPSTIPTVTPLPWIEPYRETKQLPATAPAQIPIEIPLTETYPEDVTEPWNDPITEEQLTTEPVPEPDPGEETPPGENPPDDPIGDKKIDWDKLKTTFSGFTTKFPFSLPWDVSNAFDAVFPDVTDVEKPEWEFKIKKPDGTYHFQKLTIAPELEKYFGFLRSAILILFNIGLIYAIRQWFGGAS